MADKNPAPKKTFNENPSITKEELNRRKKELLYTLTHLLEPSNPKPKGTQAGHAVTDSSNHTKPVTPAPKAPTKPAMPTKRPAVGADKSAKKKYGSSSWNNGFTN